MPRLAYSRTSDEVPKRSERLRLVRSSEIVITPAYVLRWLLGALALVFTANLMVQVARHGLDLGHVYGLWRMFDVNQEANIPTYFSGLLLFAGAVLFFVIGKKCAAGRRPFAGHWLLFAALFALLSVDEVAMLHELVGRRLMVLLGDENVPNGLRWTSVYLAGAVAVTALSLRFFLHLDKTHRMLFGLAAAVFVAGAAGLEIVAGSLIVARPETEMLAFVLLFTTEETMEMLGVIILIYAQLHWLAEDRSPIVLKFRK